MPLSHAKFERLKLKPRINNRGIAAPLFGATRHGLLAIALCCYVLWLMASIPVFAAEVQVTGVRIGDHGLRTRLVIELSGRIGYHVSTLNRPSRVVVDLPHVDWPQALPIPANKGGLIRGFRYGLLKPGNSRIVLDVTAPAVIKSAFMIPPSAETQRYRLVVDIVRASDSKAATEGTAGGRKNVGRESNSRPAAPAEVRKPNIKKVIVIDPGHGGIDPGAVGSSGIFEKKLTLAAAQALQRQLAKSGRYKVVLTRRGDQFLRLRDRFAVARRHRADLFISLHADTIRKKSVRGLSVYTLSEKASDREAAELAEQENKADLIAGVDLTDEPQEVTNILIDLAQRETLNQSARFARHLVQELRQVTKLLRNSHRFAGFAVLKAPDVPSVLIEMGFLSNARDEQALRKPAYRARLARSVERAVDRYFNQIQQAER